KFHRKRMARVKPKGRPRQGEDVAATYSNTSPILNQLTRDLAVLVMLKTTEAMRAISHFCPNLAAASYKSKRVQILRWRREQPKLEDSKSTQGRTQEDKGGVWINELRGEGVPVSTKMLTIKVQELAKVANVKDFAASDKWVEGFKRRHRFRLWAPTRQGQLSPADLAAIAAGFSAHVASTMQDLGIKRVIEPTWCEDCVWVRCSGASKERVTTMLLGDIDGNKYAPFVIMKAKPSKIEETQAENIGNRNGFVIGPTSR
ncbi:Tc5 transposase DNA-binding domain, partial [Phytophthora infestans]